MNASNPTHPSGENVSEESAETSDWEDVGRELLLRDLDELELDFQEAIQQVRQKIRDGEELYRMDYAELQTAKYEAEEVLSTLDDLTEPWVFEKEEEGDDG